MITLERLQRVKVMITKLGVYSVVPISKKYNSLIVIDLSSQQKLAADAKAIQQINFTGDFDRAQGSAMFFIIEEKKEINKNSS